MYFSTCHLHDFCCFPWHLQWRWVKVMQPQVARFFFITRFSKKWLMKFDYEEIFGLSVSITFAVDNFLFLNRLWVFILFSIFCCRSQTFYEFFSLSLFSSPSVSNLYRWFHFHFLLLSTKNNPGIFLGCTHTFEASQFTCKLRRFNCKLSN